MRPYFFSAAAYALPSGMVTSANVWPLRLLFTTSAWYRVVWRMLGISGRLMAVVRAVPVV